MIVNDENRLGDDFGTPMRGLKDLAITRECNLPKQRKYTMIDSFAFSRLMQVVLRYSNAHYGF